MRQEDYLIREISKIGDLILALMGKLELEQKQPTETIRNEFLDFTGISMDEILHTPVNQLPDLLDYKKGFNNVNIERLADLFAKIHDRSHYIKALELYHISSEMDRSYSLLREAKVAKLQQQLDD